LSATRFHVELEQFLACFRIARVCQRQLGFLIVTTLLCRIFCSRSHEPRSDKIYSRITLKWLQKAFLSVIYT